MVLVEKKDGTARFCIDYRRLNSITIGDSYPLPLIGDILDSLGTSRATIFSLLDLQNAYWQIQMEEESIPYTAFTTFCGLYEAKAMPFGLKSAPSTFQRLMTKAYKA